jgi:hypothetical protein
MTCKPLTALARRKQHACNRLQESGQRDSLAAREGKMALTIHYLMHHSAACCRSLAMPLYGA